MPHPRIAFSFFGLLMMWVAAPLGCTTGTNISNAEPKIEVNLLSLDFGAVNLHTPSTLTVEVKNVGTGYLEITGVEFTPETDQSVFEHTEPPTQVGTDAPGVFQVSFIPDEETTFSGSLRIRSDAVENSILDIPLIGQGSVPDLSVDPTSLYFPASGTDEATVLLSSEGSGTVLVQSVDLYDADGVFAVALAQGYQPPFELPAGTSVEMEVTYSQGGAAEAHAGEVVITSNDLTSPQIRVNLSGAGEDPKGGEPPEVQILSPLSGSTFHAGESITLTGLATDPDEPATNLVCRLKWTDAAGDSTNVWSGSPDASGNITVLAEDLPSDSLTLTLSAVDSDDNSASATVQLLVWDDEDTFTYFIAGATTQYDYFHVDDDLAIYLNGSLVWYDDDDEQNAHGQIEIHARPGDQIQVVAEDRYACSKRLDPLTLWLDGTSSSQPLNEEVWVTACTPDGETAPDCGEEDEPEFADYEGACYDVYYMGPWPNNFVDETFTIAIP